MKISFLKLAEKELDDAVEYYESEQAGLGTKFREEVLRSLARVVEYPVSYQLIDKRARRCLVAKFPYGVIYQYKQNIGEILVVAIAHLHRKPDYWISRNV